MKKQRNNPYYERLRQLNTQVMEWLFEHDTQQFLLIKAKRKGMIK